MVKKNKQDIAKIEQDRKEKLDADYAFYFENMEARISAGEKLEIKPFDTWVRKAIKTMPDTSTVEIQVSGDSGETKHARFVRIKNMRMAKILNAMDGIINLSAAQYESSPEEQAKVVNALRLKVIDIENSFKVQTKPVYDY